MRAPMLNWRRIMSAMTTSIACLGIVGSHQAFGQFVFAPARLIDSFETPADVNNYASTGDAIYINHSQTTHGVTRGASALNVETEGAFDLDDGEFVNGWGAIGGLAVAGNYTSGSAYEAFQLAAMNPDAWELVYDLSFDADSWVEAPDTALSPSTPGDVGPDRSGNRVQLSYDGAVGTPFNTGSIWGTTGKLTVRVPFKSLYDPAFPAPTTGATTWTLSFGADNNRFAPDDPLPNGGAKHYIDNVRLKPLAPSTYDVLYDFEGAGAAAFDGWSDLGRSGTDANHKHSIVTGADIGATQFNAGTGKFEPTATGQAMLIDTSNINPGVNGFQWASTRTYNADTDNNGVVDAPAVKTELTQLVAKMRNASAFQVDVTFHDSTAVPAALTTPVVPPMGGGPTPFVAGEPNAGWLKLVLGVEMDGTPEDGVAGGLLGNQYDNEFGADALGTNIQTSRGDFAATLTTEIQPGDDVSPEEPLTFTYSFAQIGSFLNQLNSPIADNTNFLRFTFAVQTGTGDQTILASIDNFRLVTTVSLDGDYEHDGDVDGADLGVWRAQFGTINPEADGDENGIVDGNDFLFWQRHLGNDATPAVAAAGAVPEPATAWLAACALALAAARRRSRD